MIARPLSSRIRSTFARDGAKGLPGAALQMLRARWALRRATEAGAVRLRGRVAVVNRGRLAVGDGVRLDGTTVRLELMCFAGAELTIGDGTYVNYGSNISAVRSVKIGSNCMIGQYAIIMDSDYHDALDHTAPGKCEPIVIEDDCWLGVRVTVLRGSHIGRGAVIGAHSVVMGDVPPYSLAAGVPARVVRRLRE